MKFTVAQNELIYKVRAALDCGGNCSDYCDSCSYEARKSIQHTVKRLTNNQISSDIILAAKQTN